MVSNAVPRNCSQARRCSISRTASESSTVRIFPALVALVCPAVCVWRNVTRSRVKSTSVHSSARSSPRRHPVWLANRTGSASHAPLALQASRSRWTSACDQAGGGRRGAPRASVTARPILRIRFDGNAIKDPLLDGPMDDAPQDRERTLDSFSSVPALELVDSERADRVRIDASQLSVPKVRDQSLEDDRLEHRARGIGATRMHRIPPRLNNVVEGRGSAWMKTPHPLDARREVGVEGGRDRVRVGLAVYPLLPALSALVEEDVPCVAIAPVSGLGGHESNRLMGGESMQLEQRTQTRTQAHPEFRFPQPAIEQVGDHTMKIWWAMRDSNLRPLPCEGSTLPLS